MKKNPWLVLLGLFGFFGLALIILVVSTSMTLFGSLAHFSGRSPIKAITGHSILKLKLEGIIMDSEKFVKNLRKYAEDDRIKAIVIEINSHGGVVGPSQEINAEIKKVKEETQKPIIAVSTGLMASGAYYAAVAADEIVVQPGTLMGSIGVIMEFVNLEKLMDWAKIRRYSITTGKFKDSGAEYRPMRDDERELFQNLVNDTWKQFKEAVAEGRDLDINFVTKYADGRIMTGSQGVALGFADKIGTTHDAYEMAADAAGIDDYEIFELPKHRPSVWDFIAGGGEDEPYSRSQIPSSMAGWSQVIQQFLRTDLANKPLYLMPGAW